MPTPLVITPDDLRRHLLSLAQQYGTCTVEYQTWLDAWLEGGDAPWTGPLPEAPGAFTAEVWRAAVVIPRGTTVTYGQLARAMGRPGAARAVARAMSLNRLPVAIPCHRVVAADGPGGFSWGLDLKLALLEFERCQTPH